MSTAGEIAILLSEYDNLKAYIKTLRNTNEALLNAEKNINQEELEKYVQELTEDVLEMIHDASPEEKMALSQKMTTLANKIK